MMPACPSGRLLPEGMASIDSIEAAAQVLERTVLDAAAGRGTVTDLLRVGPDPLPRGSAMVLSALRSINHSL